MPQTNQTRPDQGRVGCDLLPGAPQPTLNCFANPTQQYIGPCCPHRRSMLVRHRSNFLRLEISRLEAVIRNFGRIRKPRLSPKSGAAA